MMSLPQAVAILLACCGATAAAAQRPYAPAIQCRSLKALIARDGAALLSTGPRTFDRFVSQRRFCASTEVTDPAWIAAADDARCFVGYTCREYDNDRFR